MPPDVAEPEKTEAPETKTKTKMSEFARSVYEQKYAWRDEDGNVVEDWPQTALRVTSNVLGTLGYGPYDEEFQKILSFIEQRKFMPGGRYLYASGRGLHQIQNCLLLKAEDSREGWAELLYRSAMALQTGAGIGVDYSEVRCSGSRIRRTGGVASGPLSLMRMVNEVGRGVMQGGARRCLPFDSPVHTQYETKAISEVQVGDNVMTSDGYRKVTGVINQGIQDTIFVKTQNGALECTSNHRVAVLDGLGSYSWKEAGDLEDGDSLYFVNACTEGQDTCWPANTYDKPALGSWRAMRLASVKSITVPDLDEGSAWLLGLIHGDGHVSLRDDNSSGTKRHGRIGIACANDRPEIIEAAVSELSRWAEGVKIVEGDGDCSVVMVYSVQLASYMSQFKQSGVSISIPKFIQNGSPLIRAAYVAGLQDADGSCDTRPFNIASSVYKEHLEEVQILLSTLGVASRICLVRSERGNWKSLYHLNIVSNKNVKLYLDMVGGIGHKTAYTPRTGSQHSYSLPRKLVSTKRKDDLSISIDQIEKDFGPQTFTPVKVIGIGPARSVETWDIEVEDKSEFVTNGYLVHNSAIWAGLRWDHEDCEDFINMKNWPDEIRAIKEKDFSFPAEMEFTNISVLLNDEFFQAYDDESHDKHEIAKKIYKMTVENMVKTAEPGLSIDVGDNAGETLRNAPVVAATHVLTDKGYKAVGAIVDQPTTVWTGMRWAENVVFAKTYEDARIFKVTMTGGRNIRCEPDHEFLVEKWVGLGKSRRRLDAIVRVKAKNLRPSDRLHVALPDPVSTQIDKEAYTLGFIYGDGSFHKAGGVDLTLCTEESKACAPALVGAASVNESDSRGYTRLYFSVDEKWSGRPKDRFPEDLYEADSDTIKSFIAGLFDADGNYEGNQQRIRLSSKHRGFLRGVSRALEQVGILSHISNGKGQIHQLVVASDSNKDFAETIPTHRLKPKMGDYVSYRQSFVKVIEVVEDGVEDVYCADVHALEHSFMAEGVIISNCTELTSHDDSDVCNLGSINLANVESKEEMADLVKYGTLFLVAGTVYSDLPYDKVHDVREKNRRLGLGLMGIHEWLLKKGYEYGPNDELAGWLDLYASSTDHAAEWADQHNLSRPVKTRAIAPTGTIGIVAETTTGIEPIFAVAFKRRVRTAQTNGKDKVNYQYVIDPTAQRLIERDGVDPDSIEDAYALSYNVEKRVVFQAWVQQWVDHAISSTINLPYAIEDEKEAEGFADMLYKHLPKLRGVTAYPDGSRGGQPLTTVPYEQAINHIGVVFEEDEEKCRGGSCGI